MRHARPKITQLHIEQIRQLIKNHPEWNRTQISKELCEIWGWKSNVGQLKDISCRDLLRALEAKGQITLPPKKAFGRLTGKSRGASIQLSLFENDQPAPIETKLKEVTPLSTEIMDTQDKIAEFKSYIDQFHYLHYGRSVGECMRYMVRSKDGVALACLMFGSSAWRCAARDGYIGWTDEDRGANLYLTTNNTRFLILPWIRIPHLASHVLSLITRRVSQDWQTKYGHPLYLLETFVECGRFIGTCYKAANWVYVGKTAGRGRDDTHKTASLPIKNVYLYPLNKKYRQVLGGKSGER